MSHEPPGNLKNLSNTILHRLASVQLKFEHGKNGKAKNVSASLLLRGNEGSHRFHACFGAKRKIIALRSK
jgi:hypothetical protein